MIVITKKGENVNVWIQGFDDAKVESNKVAYKVTSTNIQRLSIASRLIQGQANKDQEKDKASNKIVFKRSKALVIDYQAV